jgi:hypothetical protein
MKFTKYEKSIELTWTAAAAEDKDVLHYHQPLLSLYNYNENGFIYLIYSMHKVVFVYLSVKKKSWIFFVF